MVNRLVSLLAILLAFQVGCDALKGATDKDKDKKAKKEDKEEDETEEDGDKKKKKKKEGGSSAAPTESAATPPPPPTGDAGPLIDGPAPDKKKFSAFLKDEKAPMTADMFETGLLLVAECRLDTHGVDYQCDAYKDFQKGLGHKAELDDYKGRAVVAQKYLRHKAPSVRYEAAKRALGFSSGDDAEVVKKMLSAGRAETEPQVVAAYVDSLGHLAKSKPDVKEFIFASLDHADDRVRDRSATVLGMRSNQPIAGSYEKLAEKVEKDPTKRVKAAACRALSAPEDDRALAVYEKLVDSKKVDDEVRNACFEGLIRMWTGFIYPKKPNKDAYELTMKVLEKTPRTDKLPPSYLSELGSAKSEFKDYDKSGKDWAKEVKGFYKKERLVKALEELVLDSDANNSARSSALYTLKPLGAKAQLTSLATKLKTKKDSSSKYLSETAARLSKEKD